MFTSIILGGVASLAIALPCEFRNQKLLHINIGVVVFRSSGFIVGWGAVSSLWELSLSFTGTLASVVTLATSFV